MLPFTQASLHEPKGAPHPGSWIRVTHPPSQEHVLTVCGAAHSCLGPAEGRAQPRSLGPELPPPGGDALSARARSAWGAPSSPAGLMPDAAAQTTMLLLTWVNDRRTHRQGSLAPYGSPGPWMGRIPDSPGARVRGSPAPHRTPPELAVSPGSRCRCLLPADSVDAKTSLSQKPQGCSFGEKLTLNEVLFQTLPI